jgi:hypothetical protein
MPKAYGFDTGFVSFCRGWDPLRPDDCGPLWEHLVLETLQAHRPYGPIHYWRDAAGREIDFILPVSRDQVDTVECKWNADQFDATALRIFRTYYPHGSNYLVTPTSSANYTKMVAGHELCVCNPGGWASRNASQR